MDNLNFRVSSHRLEIEDGRSNRVPNEKSICRLGHDEIEDRYNFTYKYLAYIEIRGKYQDIHETFPTLSKLFDTSDIKTLWRYTLELKQHKEIKLQNVNHYHSNIH